MDSSSETERDEPSKPSSANGGRTGCKKSSWNLELDLTSASSSSESQPCVFDRYQGDNDGSIRLEMDLFVKPPPHLAATSSYSSPDKYWDDFFRLIPSKVTKTRTGVLFQCRNSDTGTLTSNSSSEPTSMVFDLTHDSPMHAVSPGQSPPPPQVMVRSGGYDPGRIPSSVFEMSKGPVPVEWSFTSNDSLFSIHIGNISFLSDTFLTLTEDLQKPKEMGKIDELVGLSLLLQDEEASYSPITQLDMDFQDKENAAGVVNAVELNQGNGSIVTQMPSLNNGQHDRSSSHPVKKASCSHWFPKPRFRWLRTTCCGTNGYGCPSSSCPTCSLKCCCSFCGRPSNHCKCPSPDCDCTCPSCNCSRVNCCFRCPSCCRGCGCNCSSCCDRSCCSRECCCSCPSCCCCMLSFSCRSSFSCQKCSHCC